jgi:ketosteroid isomerase-like protein
MRRQLCMWLLVAATVTVGAVPVGQSVANDAAVVEALERALVKAIGARDLVTYDRLVADDYIVVRANGQESTKAQVLATYRADELAYVGLDITDVKTHVFGDTAIVSARTLGTRKEGGTEVPNRVRYIRIFARRQGEWRAVSQMATPAREP